MWLAGEKPKQHMRAPMHEKNQLACASQLMLCLELLTRLRFRHSSGFSHSRVMHDRLLLATRKHAFHSHLSDA